MFKIIYIFVLIFTISFTTLNVKANSLNNYVILGGDSIGLSLKTNVYVTGHYDICIDNQKIKVNDNILVNDYIYKLDGKIINNSQDIFKIVTSLKEYDVTIYRDNLLINTKIKAYKDDSGKILLGLYIKDNVIGVGTLTYVNPKTKRFASLGHCATECKILNGSIQNSIVSGIKKAHTNSVGEKKAIICNNDIGEVTDNNDYGVFGNAFDIKNGKLIKLVDKSKVHLGKAQIVTVINKDVKEIFDIEIIDLKNSDTKGIKFKVTSTKLLDLTGGIICGMSGSPIIQDNNLVGAVSHVTLNDSKIGYGVYASNMSMYA